MAVLQLINQQFGKLLVRGDGAKKFNAPGSKKILDALPNCRSASLPCPFPDGVSWASGCPRSSELETVAVGEYKPDRQEIGNSPPKI